MLSIADILEYKKDYTIFPLYKKMFADEKTPIEIVRILKTKFKMDVFLFESAKASEKWGRYTFIGFNSKFSVTNKEEASKILKKNLSPKLDELPPFTGGLVGSVEYNFINNQKINFRFFDNIIAFDNVRQLLFVIKNISFENLEEDYYNAIYEIEQISSLIQSSQTLGNFDGTRIGDIVVSQSEEQYFQNVEKVKEYIRKGDIFQAVIANRIESQFRGDLLSSYRKLRTINPSAYMFYLDFIGTQIIGASPETLISLRDNLLSTFPIAGTRKRGSSDEEDEKLIKDLLSDEKERAEHNMLVDLGRNDIGKISKIGTVNVDKYMEILKLSHVIHISSTVTGILDPKFDHFDIIESILPAGTLSGAPKIRAMEIIEELENFDRGVYGGAIGYIDFSGNLDFCISIRMACLDNIKDDIGTLSICSGAGIVFDSQPKFEYQETLNKMNAMLLALGINLQ